MQTVHDVSQRAARRLGWDRANKTLARAAMGILGAAFLGIIADRLVYLGLPVLWALALVAAAVLPLAFYVSLRRWPGARAGAIETDERLRLGERLSSALAVADDSSPMARAVMADAEAYARQVPVVQTFPLRMHREVWCAVGLALLTIGAWAFMPQFDLLARKKAHEEAVREKEELKREAVRVREKVAALRKRIEREGPRQVERHLDAIEKLTRRMEKGEIHRAEALARLSELSKDIQKEREGLARADLKPSPAAGKSQSDLARDLAKALADKDFAKAADELKALAQKAASGQMSREDLTKLSKELQQLAAALPDAKDLAEALRQCASALGEADAKALGKALADAKLELDKQADVMKELEALAQCAGLCNGMGSGLAKNVIITDKAGIYTPGEGREPGGGMGRAGIGRGGVAPVQPHDVRFQTDKVPGQMLKGRVVGSFFADGKSLRGEAKAEYVETVQAAHAEAAEALQKEEIPRAYEGYVRDYFEAMRP